MKPKHARPVVTTALAAIVLVACQGGQESPVRNVEAPPAVDAGAPEPMPNKSVPGDISTPINFDYAIVGNPVVGRPVGVNVQVSTPLNERPISLHYRVDEAGSMTFPESQAASATLLPIADAELRSHQVTVLPQREGRIYLVVSAEIETDTGKMMKSMSIPIQVGRAPAQNGPLVEGDAGELGGSRRAKDPE